MEVDRNGGAPRSESEYRGLRRGWGAPRGAVVVKSTGGDWCKDFCTFWSILRFNFFSGRGV